MDDAGWDFFEPFIASITCQNGHKASNKCLALDGGFWKLSMKADRMSSSGYVQ